MFRCEVALTSVNVLVAFGSLAATKSRLLGSNCCWLIWGRAGRPQTPAVCAVTHNICLVIWCKVTYSAGDYTALKTDGRTSIINNYCNKCCIEVISNLTSQRRERNESNLMKCKYTL